MDVTGKGQTPTKVYLICCPKTEMHRKRVPFRGKKGPVERHVSYLVIEGEDFYFRFAQPSANFLTAFVAEYLEGGNFSLPLIAVCEDCKKAQADLNELTNPHKEEEDGA